MYHEYSPKAWKCSADMGMQHRHGLAMDRECRMNMEMQDEHRHAVWTLNMYDWLRHAACSCPCCMEKDKNMLDVQVHVHAAFPCPCYKDMEKYMQHAQVPVRAALSSPCCIFMFMLHIHVHATYPNIFCISMSIPHTHVYAHGLVHAA